jgi:hypothetical protein
MEKRMSIHLIIVCLLSLLMVSFSSCKKDEPEEEEEEETLSEVRLNSVFIEHFEETDENDQPWDVNDGPDLWVQVARQTTVLWESEVHENANQSTIYDFHVDSNVEFENFDEEYTLRLFDLDEDGESTLMNNAHFSPSQYISTGSGSEWYISKGFGFQCELFVELVYE